MTQQSSSPDIRQNGANSKSPLEELVQNLHKEFSIMQEDGYYGNTETITDLMNEYVANNDDYKDYCFSCPYKYTRNLIAKSDVFELMVICWKKGQPSPIHNHEEQRCWMGCVKGRLQETYYVFQDTKDTHGSGLLEESHCHPIENGSVGYITDEIAFHKIESLTEDATSIHLYSRPITECNIYCPLTGAITRRKLGYFTQYKSKESLNVNTSFDYVPTTNSYVSTTPAISTTQ